MSHRLIAVILVILVGLAVGCSPLLSDGEGSDDVGAATHTDLDDSDYIPFGDAPRRGEASAPVVVVEFADFNDCQLQGHVELLDELVDERDEQLQVVVRHAPETGDRESRHASMAVEAAGQQDKFWEMRRLFAESCPTDPRSDRDSAADRAMEFARKLELDLDQFRLDANHPQILERVQRDQRIAQTLQVERTTSFFVNGRRWEPTGEVSVDQFDERIDDAWQRSLQLLGEGVDWNQLYSTEVLRMLEADDRIDEPRQTAASGPEGAE